MWVKEKLLVTSNFSFSHSVFKRLVSQERQKVSKGDIVWEWFNRLPNKPLFIRVCSTSLLKTLREKEILLVTSNFSFSQCFLPVRKTFCRFHQIWNCRLQSLSVSKSLKFVVWERVVLAWLSSWLKEMHSVTFLTENSSNILQSTTLRMLSKPNSYVKIISYTSCNSSISVTTRT